MAERAAVLSRPSLLPAGVVPRGLCREAAAEYIGVGTTKFDELIAEGLMPRPKHIGARRVWDSRALDAAFEALPTEAEKNEWD
jgi:predicted DNA-binding transcriptional regulator AlpA